MILILTGPVHSGKTTLLKKVIRELKPRNILFDGFLSESVWQEGRIFGYDLFDVKLNKTTPYLRLEGREDWERIGSYYFLPEGLTEAKRIIRRHSPTEWLIVDEIGPLELSGKGIWPPLSKVFVQNRIQILCVVRRTILENFIDLIGQPKAKVYDIQDKDPMSDIFEGLTSLDNSVSD